MYYEHIGGLTAFLFKGSCKLIYYAFRFSLHETGYSQSLPLFLPFIAVQNQVSDKIFKFTPFLQPLESYSYQDRTETPKTD